jgi:hypothetical protein
MTAASAYDGAEEQERRKQQIGETEGFFLDAPSEFTNGIASATHLDPHMLNRAEWIKFVAAFFNLEDAAQKHMDEEAKRWEALRSEAAAKEATPHVAFIDNSGWSGHYHISLAAYKTVLVEAAGGKSFSTEDFSSNSHAVVEGTTVKFNSTNKDAVAAFHAALADVHVLIDETYAWNPPAYNEESFKTGFGFEGDISSALIFRVDGLLGGTSGNGLDWFEGAFARPADVLEDFVAVMHSTNSPRKDRTYLRALTEAPAVMTAANCTYDVPACAGGSPKTIDAPCSPSRYNCEIADDAEQLGEDETTTDAPTTTGAGSVEDEESSTPVAAALVIVAAAFA